MQVSESVPEAPAGRTIMGIPAPVVIIGVAALAAYFLFFRNKSGSAAGGTTSTGTTTITAPALPNITVNLPTPPRHRTRNPQPHHRPHKRHTRHVVHNPKGLGGGGTGPPVRRKKRSEDWKDRRKYGK